MNTVLAVLGWLVVGWLPGLLLCCGLRFEAGLLRNAALAPVVSIGLNMIVAELMMALSVPVRSLVVLPISYAAAVLVFLSVRWRPSRAVDREADTIDDRRSSVSTGEAVLLVAGMLLALAMWCAAIRSSSAVLPNDDGTHHGVFAYRILHFDTLDPRQILSGDVTFGTPVSRYYPLALHTTVALIAALTHVPVVTVFTVGYVGAASIALPLGVFALTRRIYPQLPMVAGVAGAISAAFAWFPYSVLQWGGVPLLVAMAHVPALVDGVWRRQGDGGPGRVGLLLGIGAYGIFQEHNSELASVALLSVVLTAVGGEWTAGRRRRTLLSTWLVGGVVAAILMAPQLRTLLAGAQQARNFLGNLAGGAAGPTTHGATKVLVAIVVVGSPFVLPLAAAGGVVVLRRRLSRAPLYCVGVIGLLCLLTLVTLSPIILLTASWYSNWGRISYIFSYFEAMLAAVGVVELAHSLARRLSRRGSVRPAVAVAVSCGALTLAAALLVVPQSLVAAGSAYRQSSLVGPAQRAGFAWLARHVRGGERVLNQFSDGSGWMQVLAGVTPVFGTKADDYPSPPSSDWGERGYLLIHYADLDGDTRAQRAARMWDVRYVYVSDRCFALHRCQLSPQRLSASSAFRLDWHRGRVWIFEFTDVRGAPLRPNK